MIKNIVFDLGNVIISFNRDMIISAFTDRAEEKKYLFERCFCSPEWVKLDLGEITAAQAAAAVNERENNRYPKLTEAVFYEWFRYAPVNREALLTVRTLKKRGYKIFVLSNMHKAASEYFKNAGVYDGFDGVIVSADVHIKKPDGGIFRLLLERYGINACETLFIDDDDTGKSYLTANSLGFSGRRVKPNDTDDILAVLSEYGVLI